MARSRRAEPDAQAEEGIGATKPTGFAMPSRERDAQNPGADAARAAELGRQHQACCSQIWSAAMSLSIFELDRRSAIISSASMS